MSICNRLNLQTLGSQLVMPKNLPDHWSGGMSFEWLAQDPSIQKPELFAYECGLLTMFWLLGHDSYSNTDRVQIRHTLIHGNRLSVVKYKIQEFSLLVVNDKHQGSKFKGHHSLATSKGHFAHEPGAVTMRLWEPKWKCPKAVLRYLQNHVVWSRTLKCSVKSYVARQKLQHCKSVIFRLFLQGMTKNVSCALSVGDTTWTCYNWYWARQIVTPNTISSVLLCYGGCNWSGIPRFKEFG